MKKFFLVALATSVCFVSNAQFVITVDGLKSQSDNTKDYIVITQPNSNANDNFRLLKEWIVTSYVSAKNVLSEANGNVLSIHSVYEFPVRVSVNCTGSLDYTATFTCREDRVKMDITINEMSARVGNGNAAPITINPGGGMGSSSIFDRRGSVGQDDFKEKIESFINNFAQEATNVITRTTEEDNW